jgi:hypothetical protein
MAMPVNREALILFCDPFETRYALEKPWIKDGVEYATDGRISVYLDATGQQDTMEDNRRYPNVKEFIDRYEPEKWFPFPGSKELWDLSDQNSNFGGTCHWCLGFGRICWNEIVAVAECCETCDGSGYISGQKMREESCNFGTEIQFPNVRVSRHFIERVRVFAPAAEFGEVKSAKKGQPDILRFRFEGGQGSIVGMRAKEEVSAR